VRFDEAMRGGYEDWDFWLTLVELGYRGMHCADLELHYRRRPASMLATSHTIDDELRAYLHKKHDALFEAKSVLQLDLLEAPRYLSYVADTQQYLLHHHPSEPREVLSLADCAERLRRASDNSPAALPIGQGMCFTTGAAYSALGAASLAGAVLH